MGTWQISDRYWALGAIPASLAATVAANQTWTTSLWVVMTLVFVGTFVPSLAVFAAFWAGRAHDPPRPTSIATAFIVAVFVAGLLRNVEQMTPSVFMGLVFASIAVGHLAGALAEGRTLRFDLWCLVVGSSCAVWGITFSLDQSVVRALGVGFLYFVYGWLVTAAALARLESQPTPRMSAGP